MIIPKPEPVPPTVPMDYDWARVSLLYFLQLPINKRLFLF
jgi:hypothetical protein